MIPVMLSIRSQKNITFQTVELDWTKLEVIRSYLSASYGWTAGDYTMSYVDSDGDEVTVEAQ